MIRRSFATGLWLAQLRVIPRLDASTLRLLAFHVVAVTLRAVALLVAGVGIRTGGRF